jgi:hypothetical protein
VIQIRIDAHNIVLLACVIMWLGGALVFMARLLVVQSDYFSRFAGLIYYPFNFKVFFRPTSLYASSEMLLLTFQRQLDPTLEALRRKIFQRWLQLAAWIFGAPIPFVIVLVLLLPPGNVP